MSLPLNIGFCFNSSITFFHAVPNGKNFNISEEEIQLAKERRKDFILIKPKDSLYVFRYRSSKNDLCLYKDNACVYYLEK